MFRLQFRLPEDKARRFFYCLDSLDDPPFLAVSLAERAAGAWSVDIYCDAPPASLAALGLSAPPFPGFSLDAAILSEIAEEDWVAKSQTGLAPVRAGRFLVHGSHDRATAGRVFSSIEVDAAQAFGTAHNGTTRGCLLAIEQLAARRVLRRGPLLDLGTGSGILAIAAAKLWQRPVLASDCDPMAVHIARNNARRNGVARLVRCVQAQGFAHPAIRSASPFRLVIANVLAEPLRALAPEFRRHISVGGFVVLSGLLNAQARMVAARFRTFGFVVQDRIDEDEWSTLILRRQTLR